MSGPDFDDGAAFSSARRDDGSLAVIESIIGALTAAVATWLNDEPDQLEIKQGMLITAAMMFSGRVAGHMQGVGAINRDTAKKLERVVAVNFREGKKLGLREAAEALRGQAQ